MAAKKKPAGKAAKVSDWTRNRTGKQPVADDVWVEARLRNGGILSGSAGTFQWNRVGLGSVGDDGDIMVWRRARKPRQPKADPIPHEVMAVAAGLGVKPEKVAEDLAAAVTRSITGLSPQHVVLPPVPAPAPAPSEPEPELPHEDDDLFTRGQIISAFVVCSLIVVGLLMYLRHTLPAVVAP